MSGGATIYVVVDIGCLECGEPSAIVGLFRDADAAEAARAAAEQHDERGAGQHDFETFEAVLP